MRFFLNYFSLTWRHNLQALNGILALETPLGSAFRNYILLAVLFEEGFLEGSLRSELVIAPFAERFKVAAVLSKSY